MSCPSCIAGEVLNGEPTGVNDAFQDAYFAAGKGTSTTAVILFSDIFGLPLKNCKLLADKFAKDLGCDVWVPDMFNGKQVFQAKIAAFHLVCKQATPRSLLDP